jgi:hypothetical protein
MQLPDSRCKHVIELWGLDKAWVKSHWKEFKPIWETLAAVANATAFECDTASICVENFTNMEDPEDNLSVGEIRRNLDNTIEAIDDFKNGFLPKRNLLVIINNSLRDIRKQHTSSF